MMVPQKKVLVVTQHFWPENFRITDIVDGFLEDGLAVDVLCGLPNYPKGEWFPGYNQKGPFCEDYHGAHIYRCKEIPRKGNTGIRIFLNYCSWPLYAYAAVKRLSGSYDAIFCYNTSPVLMILPAIRAGRLFRTKVATYVLDIWPENLYSVLPIKSRLLQKIACDVSDWLYKKSDRLIALSPGLKERLQHRTGKISSDIALIPQYCEDFYANQIIDEKIEASYSDCFNLVFAGNFSPAQSLETIIAAVEKVNQTLDSESVHLLLVGDGMSRESLEKIVEERHLENMITFYGSVQPEQIPAINGAADVLVVSLSDSPDLGLTIPAKIASCMAAGKPILASMNGEGAKVIAESEGGLVSSACDSEALSNNILNLFNMTSEQRSVMGGKSKSYYFNHFRRDILLKKIEDFLFAE